MTVLRALVRSAVVAPLVLALCAGGLFVPPAQAADCYAVGQQVAAQKGGTLAKASSSSRGGQQVCVIVVLVPGKDGQRPRRTEVVVPQG
jgi:hypothetical protein